MDMEPLNTTHLAERLRTESQEYWLHIEAKSPLEKYPAKQHARRVLEKLGVDEGLVFLPGARARNNEDSDMPAPFRQRRYFYYLSGCNEPNCHLTYDIQHDSLALFIPRIDAKRVIWNGRGSTPSEALDKYDIDEVYYVDELTDFLKDWATYRKGRLYTLRASQTPAIPGFPAQVDFAALQPAIDLARVVKDDHEIGLIRKANDISSRAHREVLARILDFKNEAQVEGLFLDVCISEQAKEQAYDPIAASGPNAGTLHYDANNEDFDDRQLMCLDAGCEYQLYASDITRTFPLSGDWPSGEARNIYRLVERMQETCIERLAPGVRYLDLHVLAHQIAIDGLLSLGILHNGTREEIYKAGTSKAFFPHGLGHHVGLEVHDVGHGDLMSMTKGNPKYEKAPSLYPENFHLPVYDVDMCMAPTDPQSGHLEEGMVVTVEPGIYFSKYALKTFYLSSPIHAKFINIEVVNRYFPVGGVRIEDDILITSKGHENLTTAPKGEDMLNIIRSGSAQRPSVSSSAGLRSLRGTESKVASEEPLQPAPGLSRQGTQPILQSLCRASTAPAEKPKGRNSVDFEPFEGPSLFSNFKCTRTTEENVQQWRESQKLLPHKSPRNMVTALPRIPICGDDAAEFKHAYVELGDSASSSNEPGVAPKPMCRNCSILIQTVGRLRQSLSQSSPKSESTPTFELAGRHSQASTNPAMGNPQPNSSMSTLWEKMRGASSDAPVPVRRAATFDNYVPSQTTRPSDDFIHSYYRTPTNANTHEHHVDTRPENGSSTSNSRPVPRSGLYAAFERERERGFGQDREQFRSHARVPISRPSMPILRSEIPATVDRRPASLSGHPRPREQSPVPHCQACHRSGLPHCQRPSASAICYNCQIRNKVCANMPTTQKQSRQSIPILYPPVQYTLLPSLASRRDASTNEPARQNDDVFGGLARGIEGMRVSSKQDAREAQSANREDIDQLFERYFSESK